VEIVSAATQPQNKSGPDSSTGFLRRRGRDFIISLYGTLRAIKLYPVEHTAVQRSLSDLSAIARHSPSRGLARPSGPAGEHFTGRPVRLHPSAGPIGPDIAYGLDILRD